MKARPKTPDELLADLVRGYGSFAEAGRKFAKVLGVKESTASKYIAQASRRERKIEGALLSKIKEKTYYQQVVKPRNQIRAAKEISDKIDIALNSASKQIELTELLPKGVRFFGFDFQEKLNNDPRYKYVIEAIEKGLNIRVNAISEGEEGIGKSTGVISGMDPIKTGKKVTRKYLSEMYHILRRAYNKTGAASWIVSGFEELGGMEIE